MVITRKDGRQFDQVRKMVIHKNFLKYALGSCLIEMGQTKVICAVNMDNRVPFFLKDMGTGWITAEYNMLPYSSQERISRTAHTSGRSQEIKRLIGRSLRAIIDLDKLGERTLWIDCDVLQADGGTRTASVTGAFIALIEALHNMRKNNLITVPVVRDYLAAVSVGIVGGETLLDLNYGEDKTASVDMNVAMTGKGEFVEIQGTGEGIPFSGTQLSSLLKLAEKGIREIVKEQKELLKNEMPSLLGYSQSA